jgi:hypothetical protein
VAAGGIPAATRSSPRSPEQKSAARVSICKAGEERKPLLNKHESSQDFIVTEALPLVGQLVYRAAGEVLHLGSPEIRDDYREKASFQRESVDIVGWGMESHASMAVNLCEYEVASLKKVLSEPVEITAISLCIPFGGVPRKWEGGLNDGILTVADSARPYKVTLPGGGQSQ